MPFSIIRYVVRSFLVFSSLIVFASQPIFAKQCAAENAMLNYSAMATDLSIFDNHIDDLVRLCENTQIADQRVGLNDLIFALKASVRAFMSTGHWSCAIFLAFG